MADDPDEVREESEERSEEPAAGADAERAPVSRWWTHRLPTRSGVLIGVLLALLGFALAVQLKDRDSDQGLAAARQEDLVRILDDLDSRKERLQHDISDLNSKKQQLNSGEQGRKAAVDDARQRADELGILAGTLPAEGPGLSIVFRSGRDAVAASVLLDAVEELRGAGAEAMQVAGSDGRTVRVVASTAFVDSGSGVSVGSARLSAPYTVSVIGDPATMQAALNIPGGVVDTVRQSGGSVSVREPSLVRVSATRATPSPRYARPVS
ncbi:DUF881 domain-containing protein [Actinocatenispora rupis]|uniref:Membrane protein n=1 Tax=Actinocatenispora rupis TaxID=519421 RepID=A0A8J3J6M2_9ACTN|nr:DUF881 domain-containing protein [Actinocatenispora rupis]GID12586.1 membrane protein [Actinocatenispora rupis]